MTQDEMTRLKTLAAAATPGPWVAGGDVGQGEVYGADGWSVVGASEPSWEKRTVDANAAFIAAARTAVPALIAEVERLRAENAMLRTELGYAVAGLPSPTTGLEPMRVKPIIPNRDGAA